MTGKTKIFAIGASGLVGSRIKELLKDTYQIDNLSLETGVDITKEETLEVIENDTDHEIVLHLAAKADVDGCEKDKVLGEKGDAYRINVLGTKNVIAACQKAQKKLIYISTDFVFDGEKPTGESYSEEDMPRPINWYAQTKYEGEELVRASGLFHLILRIAYPYSPIIGPRKDFVQAIRERLDANQEVKGVTDHIMMPTYLDDIAYALDILIKHDEQGIFHVVGSQQVTPYEAAIAIAERFGYDSSLIIKTTRTEFFKDRAPRPYNLALNHDKIKKLGVTMRSFEEGLAAIL